MGRPRKTADKPKQQKTKKIKKASQSQIEQESQKIQSKNNREEDNEFLKWLNNLTIKKSIQNKLSLFTQVLNQVRLFGMSNKPDNNIRQKLRVNCQKAGTNAISSFISDAQDTIGEQQRELFKQINALQRSFNELQTVLVESNNFNEIQIDQILEFIEKKIKQKKENISVLDKLVQKGKLILNQKEDQNV